MVSFKRNKLSWLSVSCVAVLTALGVQAQQMVPTDVEAQQLTDAMAQTSGEFDAMNLNYIHSLGMQQKAWNDPLSHLGEGQTKPGYSRYTWTPEVVLPVRLREGMMTLINLPTWELIEKVHIGSPESFGGEIAAPNSLLVYADPSYIGVDSNMIIFGRSGNRYVFYLRSETYNTDKITHSVVDVLVGPKFTPVADGGQLGNFNGATATASYTQRGAVAPGWAGRGSSLTPGGSQNPQIGINTASTAPKDWLQNIPVDPEKFRFDVEIFLPDPAAIDIAPDKVWRDDIFTYIDLGPKALTMTQRPVVSLIVQDSEVPVGFRTRGPNSRLIVVEAVGDLVLRNGKKIICLKLRRDPASGLEYTDYSGDQARTWYAPSLPSTSGNGAAGNGNATTAAGMDLSSDSKQAALSMDGKTIIRKSDIEQVVAQIDAQSAQQTDAYNASIYQAPMAPLPGLPAGVMTSPEASAGIVGVINQVSNGANANATAGAKASANANASATARAGASKNASVQQTVTYTGVDLTANGAESVSVELASDANIAALEASWDRILADNADVLNGYEPYYSVDTTADGDVKELFHLRVGPMKNVQAGDNLCHKLGRRGYSCSVIRVQ